jgi:hypothetical protein
MSRGEKVSPLGENGVAVQLEILSAVEGALRVEIVVNRGIDWGALLQR